MTSNSTGRAAVGDADTAGAVTIVSAAAAVAELMGAGATVAARQVPLALRPPRPWPETAPLCASIDLIRLAPERVEDVRGFLARDTRCEVE
jgi:hypothetical protein